MYDYDIIIIGGGIGGTAFAAILASRGFKILLIEKNNFLGGRCSTYEKGGFKIDVGVHLFGRSSKGPHGEILNMIGMEDAIDWVLCRKPGQDGFIKESFGLFQENLKNLSHHQIFPVL